MAYPTIRNRTETPGTSASTTLTINFGTNVAGDLCVIFLGTNDTARAITATESFTDWTNTNATFHVLYKVLDGTEGTSTTVTVAASTKYAAIAYTIEKDTFSVGGYYIATVATGTSTAPNSGSLSPAPGSSEYLWLSAFRQNGEEADDDTWVTAAPSTPGTFTSLLQVTSGTASTANTNGSVGSAEYTATTATVDPGAFTVAQSLAWRAYTVAIHAKKSGSFTASALTRSIISSSFSASAVISKTWLPSFSASAIAALQITGSASASAVVRKEQLYTFSASAVVFAAQQAAITASALVQRTDTFAVTASALLTKTQESSFAASALVFQQQTGSFGLSAIVTTTQTGSLAADAVVFATAPWDFTADAQVIGLQTAPVWVSPENDTNITNTPVLVFQTPATIVGDQHFHIQLDKVDTFDGPDLRDVKSNLSQVGWEYYDGDSWEPLTADGMPAAFKGNEARYTVQTALSTGTWYRRVRAG